MTAHTETRPATGDPIGEGAGMVAALGIVTMVLFPFAIPGIALTVAALLPLLLLSGVVVLLAAVATAPVAGMRWMGRRRRGR